MSVTENENANRLIRLTEVKRLTGLARSTIYERVQQGMFPSPIPLGGRNVGWVEAEVAGWINTRIAEARKSHIIGKVNWENRQ